MVKKKDSGEEALEAVMEAIGRTKRLKERIHAELGLTTATDERLDNDLYEFQYKKPDYEHRSYIILHGKCTEAGQKHLRESGYEFLQIRHFPFTDKSFCRTRCGFCKKRLDEKASEKYLQERAIRLKKQHEDYLEEKAIREEWEAEQILLGKM